MKKWVATVERFDTKNTCTTHCILKFSFAEKINVSEKRKPDLYDVYTTYFEMRFQASTNGVDRLTSTNIKDSDWYAPEIINIRMGMGEERLSIVLKAIKKLININSPAKALEVLKAKTVIFSMNQLYYIKEVGDCSEMIRSPIEAAKLNNIS